MFAHLKHQFKRSNIIYSKFFQKLDLHSISFFWTRFKLKRQKMLETHFVSIEVPEMFSMPANSMKQCRLDCGRVDVNSDVFLA